LRLAEPGIAEAGFEAEQEIAARPLGQRIVRPGQWTREWIVGNSFVYLQAFGLLDAHYHPEPVK
jgi:hypothetical protein